MAARGASALLAVEDFALTPGRRPVRARPRRLWARSLPPRLRARARRRRPVPDDGGCAEKRRARRRRRRGLAAAKYDLAISRRLTLAARAGATPALLTLPTALCAADAFHRRRDAFRDRRRPSPREPSAGAGEPLPGARPLRRGSSRRAGQGAGRRRSDAARSSARSGVARSKRLTNRRFLSLWLPRLATDLARRGLAHRRFDISLRRARRRRHGKERAPPGRRRRQRRAPRPDPAA